MKIAGLLLLILSLVLTGTFACKGKPATIVPEVQVNKRAAEMGTPIEVTYSFSTKKEYVALNKEYTVFVHFIDSRDNRRFQDDHLPPKGTSEWRPEGNYNYTRTVFIPKNIPAGEYRVVTGIYDPKTGERLPLEGKAYGNRSYEMGTLLIEIPPQEPVMQYTQGWYDPESEPGDVGKSWRWTKKEAILKVRNPNSDSLLYVKLDGVPERFPGEAQTVSILIGDHVVDSIPMETNQPQMKKYEIDQSVLGNQKTVELKVRVDKTFIPASQGDSRDTRELGVRVYQLYLGRASD